MVIKAIYFDFDDTLGDRSYYSYMQYKELVETFVHVEDLYEKEAMIQDLILFDERGNQPKDRVKELFENKYNVSIDIEDFREWWIQREYRFTKLFDSSREVLETLRSQGYKIGIITNGDSDIQRRKIHIAGIEDLLDCVVVSGDYKVSKPDVKLFEKALELLDVKPNEAIMVGDMFYSDMLGAHHAGMHTIWLSKREYTDENICMIRDIKEVLEVIKRADY